MYVLIYYSSFLKEQEQGTISTMDNIQRQEKESGAFGENGRVSNVTINSDDIVPTVFKWDNGGRNVYITGTFNNWERQIPMHRSGNEFSYVHNLSRGKHAYKFIVDDEWRFAPDQPTVADVEGRINNFIDVSEFSPYIGDASIGKNVNIGAGTITCNYDGVKKNKTRIKDKVFIGSNSSLVAPVIINENSIVGAGSVVTKNVLKNSLALERTEQVEIKNYKKK